MKEFQGLFFEESTGMAYCNFPPIFTDDDKDSPQAFQLSGGRPPRMEPLKVPAGWRFDKTERRLPGDPTNPESALTWQEVPPWDCLKHDDSIRLAAMLRNSLAKAGTDDVDVYVGETAADDRYEQRPAGYDVIVASHGLIIFRRSAGQIARDCCAQTALDEKTLKPIDNSEVVINRLVEEIQRAYAAAE